MRRERLADGAAAGIALFIRADLIEVAACPIVPVEYDYLGGVC